MGWNKINWWRIGWRHGLRFFPGLGVSVLHSRYPWLCGEALGHAPTLIPTYWVRGPRITVCFWFAENGTKFTKFQIENCYQMLPADYGGEPNRMGVHHLQGRGQHNGQV